MLNNNCLESEVYMKRKIYESPLTLRTEVELEGEFMKASVFDPNDGKDQGVSTQQHEVNSTVGDYFTFDENNPGKNTWDN